MKNAPNHQLPYPTMSEGEDSWRALQKDRNQLKLDFTRQTKTPFVDPLDNGWGYKNIMLENFKTAPKDLEEDSQWVDLRGTHEKQDGMLGWLDGLCGNVNLLLHVVEMMENNNFDIPVNPAKNHGPNYKETEDSYLLANEVEKNKTLKHDVGNINEICQQSNNFFPLNK